MQIDFSAAVVRVNHMGILYKLCSVGIGGSVSFILTPFLSNRSQHIMVDGCRSKLVNIVSGVPQGCVLGPLLFLLYTSEIFSILENKLIGYADDSTFMAVVLSPGVRAALAESLIRDLGWVWERCELWGMKLNASKTKTMMVSRSRTMHPQSLSLIIGGTVLKESDDLVILGVTFDSKITFEKHLHSVSRAASQRLGILRKSWRVVHDRSLLGRWFRGFVLPVWEYCSAVWCSAADTHIKLQDRAVSGAQFLTGVCLSVTLLIVDPWRSCVCFIKSGIIRCTLLMVLYLDHMCQCGLHAVLWQGSGRASVNLYTASLQNLAVQKDFCSSLGVPLERSS